MERLTEFNHHLVGKKVYLHADSPYYPDQCREPYKRTDLAGIILEESRECKSCSAQVWVKWELPPRGGPQVNCYQSTDLCLADPKEMINYYDYKLPNEDFNNMANKRVADTIDVMITKGEEYALEGDRFHNFKQSSRMTLETSDPRTPKQCLMGMLMKHLNSVQDLANGNLANTEGYVNEKIGDSIAYLLLLEGLLLEERNAEC